MLAEMFNSLPVLPLAAILLLAGGVAIRNIFCSRNP